MAGARDAEEGPAATGRSTPTENLAEARKCKVESSGPGRKKPARPERMRTTTNRGSDCEWVVSAVATSYALGEKWKTTLPEWKWTTLEDEKWPLCMVGSGNDVASALAKAERTPEWVIVDGGEFHRRSVQILEARHLKKWGIRGSLSMWGIHIDKDHLPRRHKTVEKMVERFGAAVQTRLRKAYNAGGGARFKAGTRDTDFTFENAEHAFAAQPRTAWGEEQRREDFTMQRKWDWPPEPDTKPTHEADPQLRGFETMMYVTNEEARIRAADLAQWQKEGMKWIDAFTPEGKRKVLRFMHENEMAMARVINPEGGKQPQTFGKVEDLQVPPEEYRPGARGKIWVWENGVGREYTPEKIGEKVKFKVANIKEAARITGFRDARALQMLTE